MKRPLISEYNKYYHRYVTNVQGGDVIAYMESNLEAYINLLCIITPETKLKKTATKRAEKQVLRLTLCCTKFQNQY